MGRKEIKSKLLMYLMAAFMVITGIFGSISLPVRAAEEENYTVTFEAYEGNYRWQGHYLCNRYSHIK